MATWGTAGINIKGPKGDPGEDYDPSALDDKADDSAVVHNTGAENISGYKQFVNGIGVGSPTQANSAVRNDDPRLTGGSPYTITYSSTITPNLNNGNDQRVTLTGSPTIALATNPSDGEDLVLWFLASGADRTVTFNSSYEVSQPVPGRVFTIPSGTWGSVLVRNRGGTRVLMAAYPQPVANSRSMFQARASAYQTITPATTWNAVSLPVEMYDDTSGHSTSSNTSRYYAPFTGSYKASALILWGANQSTSNPQCGACLAINGNTSARVGGSQSLASYTGTYLTMVIPPLIFEMTAGQYLELYVYSSQNSRQLYGDSVDGTRLTVEYLP